MIIGFERTGDVRTSLGLGEFAPIVKKLKEEIGQSISNGNYWSSYKSESTRKGYDIEWKSILGKKDDNLHRLIAVIRLNDQLKERVRSAKWSVKGIFNKYDCKLTAVNMYPSEKFFRKFEIDYKPDHILVEIIYSKKKK